MSLIPWHNHALIELSAFSTYCLTNQMTPPNIHNLRLDPLTTVAILPPAQTKGTTKLSIFSTSVLIAAEVVTRYSISCDGRDARPKDDEWKSLNDLRHSSNLVEHFENTQVDRTSKVSPKRGRPSKPTASTPEPPAPAPELVTSRPEGLVPDLPEPPRRCGLRRRK